MELREQTERLRQNLGQLKMRYEENNPPKSRQDKQFFTFVKEQTKPVYELLADWERMALQTVQERKVHVHPQQIVSTRENYELILMHSFYIDVKRKRYMELHNSILYILDQLLRELSTNG